MKYRNNRYSSPSGIYGRSQLIRGKTRSCISREKVWTDFMKPIRRMIFRLSGIHPDEEISWKVLESTTHRESVLVHLGMVLLTSEMIVASESGWQSTKCSRGFQHLHFFMVNCNEQYYSGESNLTYFTQLFVIMLFQFLTAATGMAAMAGSYESFGRKDHTNYRQFLEFFGT